MPHLVKDEMSGGAEREGEEPGFAVTSVEVNRGQGKQDEKEKGMAKYAPIVECLTQEKKPYRFINDVREK
tara:strand:- start:98 stop:307 length:210 start_codon:yes stop_codon:yes gene_type:complete